MNKILAIDDDLNNLKVILAILNCYFPDYQVLLSQSGIEGIEIAKRELPDTILLDILMPEMDGFEVCHILKNNESTKHIPILLVSALNEMSFRIKGLNAGADAFISKPIDNAELKAQVNVMLRIKSTEDLLRKRNEKLRTLTYELAIAEEKERRKIAEYLHDGLGQAISIAAIKLSSIAREKLPPAVKKTLEESSELLCDAIGETRELVYDLSPPILYELGLIAAIKWKLEQVEKKFGIITMFRSDENSIELVNDIKVLLFRMVCELLNNAVKYSGADLIKVEIQKNLKNITIMVIDNGKGFDFSQGMNLSDFGGFGLFSVKERLETLQGSLMIESEPSLGAKIIVTIPI
ncbi:MAG: hypothetical protein A2066_09505 [Bacteroidetes bacterium GWB2_41_8]|nr:MAG: hypothetical protein A2066_09505 [Bacteroidetes bacterium GWB2_41_8]